MGSRLCVCDKTKPKYDVVPIIYNGRISRFRLNDDKVFYVPTKYCYLVDNMEMDDEYEFENVKKFKEKDVKKGIYSLYLLIAMKDYIVDELWLEKIYGSTNLRFDTLKEAYNWLLEKIKIFEEIDFDNEFLQMWQISFEKEKKLINSIKTIEKEKKYNFKSDDEYCEFLKKFIKSRNTIMLQFVIGIHLPEKKLNSRFVCEYILNNSFYNEMDIEYLEWLFNLNEKFWFYSGEWIWELKIGLLMKQYCIMDNFYHLKFLIEKVRPKLFIPIFFRLINECHKIASDHRSISVIPLVELRPEYLSF